MAQFVRIGNVPMRVVADPDALGGFILATVQVDSNGDIIESGGGGGASSRPMRTIPIPSGGGTFAAGDRIGSTAGGDEVANVLATAGGQGIITGVQVVDRDNVGGTLEIHFFSASPTLPADNAAFSLSSAEVDKLVASVRITDFASLGGGKFGRSGPLAEEFKCADGQTSLWVAVHAVTGGAYTNGRPVIRLHVQEVTVT